MHANVSKYLLLAAMSACGNQGAPLPSDPELRPYANSESKSVVPFSYAIDCEQTGGNWRSGLQACICPADMALVGETGCVPLASKVQIKDGLEVVNKLVVGTSTCGDSPGCRAAIWSGMTLAGLIGEAHIAFIFGDPGADDIEENVDTVERPSGGNSLWSYQSVPTTETVGTREACREIAHSLGGLTPDDFGLCDALEIAQRWVTDSSFDEQQFAVQTLRPGPSELTAISTAMRLGNTYADYRIVGSAGVPALRRLRVQANDVVFLDVFLSPEGKITSGRLRVYESSLDSDKLLLSKSIYFGANMTPLVSQDAALVDGQAVRNALLTYLAGQPTDALPTDKPPFIDAPLRAMLLDTGLDLRFPALLQRFSLERSVVQAWLAGDMNHSLFDVPTTRPAEALLEVAADERRRDGGHGTDVSSVLSSGLRGLKMSLFSWRNGACTHRPQSDPLTKVSPS